MCIFLEEIRRCLPKEPVYRGFGISIARLSRCQAADDLSLFMDHGCGTNRPVCILSSAQCVARTLYNGVTIECCVSFGGIYVNGIVVAVVFLREALKMVIWGQGRTGVADVGQDHLV